MTFFKDKNTESQSSMTDYAAKLSIDLLNKKLKRTYKRYGLTKEDLDNFYIDDLSYGYDKFRFTLMRYDQECNRDYGIDTLSGKFFYEEYYDYLSEGKSNNDLKQYIPKNEKEAQELIDEQVDKFISDVIYNLRYS